MKKLFPMFKIPTFCAQLSFSMQCTELYSAFLFPVYSKNVTCRINVCVIAATSHTGVPPRKTILASHYIKIKWMYTNSLMYATAFSCIPKLDFYLKHLSKILSYMLCMNWETISKKFFYMTKC